MRGEPHPRSPAEYARRRALPLEAARQVAAAVAARLPAGARTLDLGAGTGRLTHPLGQAGLRLTALDLSHAMLAHLAAERPAGAPPPARVRADARALPLPRGVFEAVITVHLLHLLPDWPLALEQALRALAPDGALCLGWEQHPPDDPLEELSGQWKRMLRSQGLGNPTVLDYDSEVAERLLARGLAREEVVAARWRRGRTPRQFLENVRCRQQPWFHPVPEDVLPRLTDDLEAWSRARFGDLDRPLEGEVSFVWHLYRAAGAAAR